MNRPSITAREPVAAAWSGYPRRPLRAEPPRVVREVTPAGYKGDGASPIPHTDDAIIEYRCEVCAYGAASIVPPACPMCGCDSWKRSSLKGGAALTFRRVGGETLLVTVPSEFDAAGAAALAETVAGIGHEQRTVVIDLTGVDAVAEPAVLLVERLGALARGSAGRLEILGVGRETAARSDSKAWYKELPSVVKTRDADIT